MAGQPGHTISALPPAHAVGMAFVNQYSNILHLHPEVMHQFYKDGSRLTRAEAGPEGEVDSLTSQLEIHEKFKALDYSDFKTEIISIDSQDSANGGVVVMVTGSHYKNPTHKRKFVQSFFLAPQLMSAYYVLNDIFRYLDEDESQTSLQEPVVANELPVPLQSEPEPSLPTEHLEQEVSVTSTKEVKPISEEIFKAAEKLDVLPAEDESNIKDSRSYVETTLVIEDPPSPTVVPSGPIPSIEETSEKDAQELFGIVTYASILRMNVKAISTAPTTKRNTSPKVTAPPGDGQASSSSSPTFASRDIAEKKVSAKLLVDGRTVYVKNLPLNITVSQLKGMLGKFGLIRIGGVDIKGQKQGVRYAFIDFEDRISAQTAVQSSPISFGDRQIYIEEKKLKGNRPRGRGPLSGIGHRYGSSPIEDLGQGTFAGRGRPQRWDKDTQFKGHGRGPVLTGTGNVGRGFNSNAAKGFRLGANDRDIGNDRRETQAGNGSRFSTHRGGTRGHRGGANMARENDAASGSQHFAPV